MRWKVWLVAVGLMSMLIGGGVAIAGINHEYGRVSCYPPRTVYTQVKGYGDHYHYVGARRYIDRNSHLQETISQFATHYLTARFFIASEGLMSHAASFGSCEM